MAKLVPEENSSFDLYSDLLTQEKASQQEAILQSCIQNLEVSVENLVKENNKVTEQNEQLKKNISALWVTAKKEIERKDADIKDLRKRLHNKNRVPVRKPVSSVSPQDSVNPNLVLPEKPVKDFAGHEKQSSNCITSRLLQLASLDIADNRKIRHSGRLKAKVDKELSDSKRNKKEKIPETTKEPKNTSLSVQCTVPSSSTISSNQLLSSSNVSNDFVTVWVRNSDSRLEQAGQCVCERSPLQNKKPFGLSPSNDNKSVTAASSVHSSSNDFQTSVISCVGKKESVVVTGEETGTAPKKKRKRFLTAKEREKRVFAYQNNITVDTNKSGADEKNNSKDRCNSIKDGLSHKNNNSGNPVCNNRDRREKNVQPYSKHSDSKARSTSRENTNHRIRSDADEKRKGGIETERTRRLTDDVKHKNYYSRRSMDENCSKNSSFDVLQRKQSGHTNCLQRSPRKRTFSEGFSSKEDRKHARSSRSPHHRDGKDRERHDRNSRSHSKEHRQEQRNSRSVSDRHDNHNDRPSVKRRKINNYKYWDTDRSMDGLSNRAMEHEGGRSRHRTARHLLEKAKSYRKMSSSDNLYSIAKSPRIASRGKTCSEHKSKTDSMFAYLFSADRLKTVSDEKVSEITTKTSTRRDQLATSLSSEGEIDSDTTRFSGVGPLSQVVSNETLLCVGKHITNDISLSPNVAQPKESEKVLVSDNVVKMHSHDSKQATDRNICDTTAFVSNNDGSKIKVSESHIVPNIDVSEIDNESCNPTVLILSEPVGTEFDEVSLDVEEKILENVRKLSSASKSAGTSGENLQKSSTHQKHSPMFLKDRQRSKEETKPGDKGSNRESLINFQKSNGSSSHGKQSLKSVSDKSQSRRDQKITTVENSERLQKPNDFVSHDMYSTSKYKNEPIKQMGKEEKHKSSGKKGSKITQCSGSDVMKEGEVEEGEITSDSEPEDGGQKSEGNENMRTRGRRAGRNRKRPSNKDRRKLYLKHNEDYNDRHRDVGGRSGSKEKLYSKHNEGYTDRHRDVDRRSGSKEKVQFKYSNTTNKEHGYTKKDSEKSDRRNSRQEHSIRRS